jgi:branched-chain amino acid aminotransferase
MATLADPRIAFTRIAHPAPVPAAERVAAIADPGFGKVFTDHMVTIEWSDGRGWHDATIGPRGPLTLDPAAAVLHYAQEIFEGLKAYRLADGAMALFRPDENARRFNASADRLAMPTLPDETFIEAVRRLVEIDREWFPTVEGGSLYLRPFMFASEAFLGVRHRRGGHSDRPGGQRRRRVHRRRRRARSADHAAARPARRDPARRGRGQARMGHAGRLNRPGSMARPVGA